jgi:hypothetical protein
LVVSGLDVDRALERCWSAGRAAGIVVALAVSRPALVTVPNFSLFHDLPREDNLHNLKRIAICWHEMAAAGVPAALHVNARTDHDWSGWAEFLGTHAEINAIAFEFATGARATARGRWYVGQLRRLVERIGRGMTLVLRGEQFLPHLKPSFAKIVRVDTAVYVKTVKRFRRVTAHDGTSRWKKSYTMIEQLLDDLLQCGPARPGG